MKQRLNEWRNGIAIAAIMVIGTFFIQDSDFHDAGVCEEFAATLLDHNRYLFCENEAFDHGVCMLYDLLTVQSNFCKA